MPFYFSYDAIIPDYEEKSSFYKKEDLHCTLSYSIADINEEQLNLLNSFNINQKQYAVVCDMQILNNHIVLILKSDDHYQLNKDITNQFSIKEQYAEKIMHVTIKKGVEGYTLDNLKNNYLGKKIELFNPKIYIKNSKTKEKLTLDLNNKYLNKKYKF